MHLIKKYLVAAILMSLMPGATAKAEVVKKRFNVDVSAANSPRAKQVRAEGIARKRFLSEYISDKLSPELVRHLSEEIDVALTPSDSFVSSFRVLNYDEGDGTSAVVTVEGDVDTSAVISALVSNHVFRFGQPPPRILLMPSGRAADAGITKTIRALIYDPLKQAGMTPTAFEGVSRVTSIQQKVTDQEVRLIASSAIEYNADYVVFIDAQPETRSASVGGYVCDLNLSYTIVRPNTNAILAEGVATDRGSGSSPRNALDRALDATTPLIVHQAIGQLYQSIFSDSDVVGDKRQESNTYTLTVLFKDSPEQLQQVIDALQRREIKVLLLTGGLGDRLQLDSSESQIDILGVLNSIKFSGTTRGKLQVVNFAENLFTAEVVRDGSQSKTPGLNSLPRTKKEPATVQLRRK